ncbi:MAG TPA: hypothetical protein VHM31_23050 [Polyangia bacterium]|nr:hypothetical protein [Polyangia bacterium]
MSFPRRPPPGVVARARRSVLAALALALLSLSFWAAGCGKTSPKTNPDALPVPRDGGTDVACSGAAGDKKPNGQACGCAGDCASGFCVDGVCCDTACTDTCKSCDIPGAPGVCSFVPAGSPPPSATTCPKSDVATCGLDGTCDGQGSCRQYPAGVVCKPGTCQGAAVTGGQVCDGAGSCQAGPQTICAPFGCDATAGQCFPDCRSDADCVAGVKCVSGSCGPKPQGAVCASGSQCASGFCADGVCCNVACTGACVSCNQPSRQGICWPVEAGVADPHKVCRDQGAPSCGQTGVCDGLGACGLYKAETVCAAPSCSATDHLKTAGTCDGLGICRPQGDESCAPFRCSGGSCLSRCTTDADCVGGQSCQKGSCGLKPKGQSCGGPGECATGFCVDGVCCDSACAGSCRSCALSTAMGTCTPIPAGSSDPRKVCTDQGAASCGTDGKCDGTGGCRTYAPGTICAGERCTGGVYTPPSTCVSARQCVAPSSIMCAPFACNGSRCFSACTADANCSAGNSCINNTCGKGPPGLACSGGAECASGFCAQGVCCSTACTGSCKSCALAGSIGVCKNVPAGSLDPVGLCLDKGTASCATNGKCDGAGSCQLYAKGTTCKGASCAGGTFTAAATCDGAGTCGAATTTACLPFACTAAGCKTTCMTDTDCTAPSVCQGGTCKTLDAGGTACTSDGACASGHCTNGFCCAVASCGTCQSCGTKGKEGTCAPVAAGTVDAACPIMAPTSCGTTGSCDGSGKCAVYADGTACGTTACSTASGGIVSPQCSGGTCVNTMVTDCAPYNCDPTLGICKLLTCTSKDDCAPGYTCNASAGAILKTCN